MKTQSIAVLLVAAVATVPAFAAGSARADVKAELVQLQKAGYDTSAGEDVAYPAALEAAQARVAAAGKSSVSNASDASGISDTSGVGGVSAQASQSGRSQSFFKKLHTRNRPVENDGLDQVYFGS